MVILPPPTSDQYFLRTAPLSTTSESSSMSDLYLRLHGDGVTSVVLTTAPPKFLRWKHTPQGSEVAVSWKPPERSFGLVMGQSRDFYAWEEVKIVRDEGDEGFFWETEGQREVLKWKGSGDFRGWVACPWVHGHPQLFWLTGKIEKELPEFMEKVVVVREWLIPRDTAAE